MTNNDIIKFFDNHNINQEDEIIADSARPEAIEEIYR